MDKKKLNLIAGILIFVLLAAVICIMLPRRTSNFNYYFELGKPWRYNLLTANQDFPIYKTDAQLEAERTQVLQNLTPCYSIATGTADSLWHELLREEKVSHLSAAEKEYLSNSWEQVYKQGVIQVDELTKLQKENIQNVKLIDSKRVAKTVSVDKLLTPKTAYEQIISDAGQYTNALKNINLSNHISTNLTFDSVSTQIIYDKLVSSISLTRDMVQVGQRIVDKGEKVNEEIYQQLISLQRAMDEKEVNHRQSLFSYIGMIVLVCIILAMLFMYLYVFREQFIEDFRNTLLLCVLLCILIVAAILLLRFDEHHIYIYFIPFAILPVMMRVFYDSRTAFFCHLVCVLIVALLQPALTTFVLVQIAAGFVTVISLKDISVRSQLAATAAFVFIVQSIVYTACYLALVGEMDNFDYKIYLWFVFNAITLWLAVYGLIIFVEQTFGFTSAIKLVEMTNVNSGLLLELAQRAPGTFQHCLQVSNLAAEAAKRVNANGLLVRVGALYHDIGKLAHPECFIENQNEGDNPLSKMSEREAAQLIIEHVKEGIRLAKKGRLPAIIINLIASHHGTSKVKYFYNKYVNAHPDEQVDIAEFSYPGPKPQTKEAAILMMADAVEARSRSLSELTEDKIAQMVEQMVGQQIADGELSETPLTLKDVEDIKHVFTECLCSINHHRIAYPELQKK